MKNIEYIGVWSFIKKVTCSSIKLGINKCLLKGILMSSTHLLIQNIFLITNYMPGTELGAGVLRE